jgi:bacterioferritin (cytochrome b1)
MKGNERIIEKLNDLLAEELTAINQYMVHSDIFALCQWPISGHGLSYGGILS